MKTEIIRKETVHANCPHCGEESKDLSWLIRNGERKHLYCDECNRGFDIRYVDGYFAIEKLSNVKIPIYIFLKHGNVVLVVERIITEDEDPDFNENTEYYYNEHTCPINYMDDVILVLELDDNDNIDADPHGVFEYLGYSKPDAEGHQDEGHAELNIREYYKNIIKVKPEDYHG